MLPCAALKNMRDSGTSDTIFTRQNRVGNASGCVPLPNSLDDHISHLGHPLSLASCARTVNEMATPIRPTTCNVAISSEYFVRMQRPSMSLAFRLSALANHVSRIIGWCSKKQVIRPDAQLLIAVMAHVRASRNESVSQFPSLAVCEHWCRSILSRLSIAVCKTAACPQPARIATLDFGPELIACHKPYCITVVPDYGC